MNFEVVFTRKPRVKMFDLEKNVKEKVSSNCSFFSYHLSHIKQFHSFLLYIFSYTDISVDPLPPPVSVATGLMVF